MLPVRPFPRPNGISAVSPLLLMLLLSVLSTMDDQHVAASPIKTTTQAEIYLSQFGYLPASARNPASGGLLDTGTWSKAIGDFQGFAGLNITGELDDTTLELMSLPRCGVKDKVGFGSDSRAKRYALQGSRWKVKALTYRISKYPKRLTRAEVDKEIFNAFGVWSKYTDLTFTAKKRNPVHIEIRFEEGEHGDGDPFDGPGGTLAHAYFPVYGGDAHFDDAEFWTVGTSRGTNLFQVAAHEFGHSLGLSHSDVREALMAPFYRGYSPVFRLDSDDIQGIQALYGRRTTQNGVSKPSPPNAPNSPKPPAKGTRPLTGESGGDESEMCNDPKIDTLFSTNNGDTYAFKGSYYYKLTENAVEAGYPKLIRSGWPGLSDNLDAAFTYKNGKTYFFKGSEYWRYTDRKMDAGYPKDIADGFTGVPDNVDAAMVWGGNGKIYFYKGSKFWRFDPLKRPPVKVSYPKPLSNWAGVPDNIDAALQYSNGYTYFFKDNKYYRFNDRTFSVDDVNPPFPRPTAHWWYGCQDTPAAFDASGNFVELDRPTGGMSEEDSESGHLISDLVFDAAGTDDRPAHDEYDSSNSNFGGMDDGNSASPGLRQQSIQHILLLPLFVLVTAALRSLASPSSA